MQLLFHLEMYFFNQVTDATGINNLLKNPCLSKILEILQSEMS